MAFQTRLGRQSAASQNNFHVALPILHPGQVDIVLGRNPIVPRGGGRFKVARMGRRFGKTALGVTKACDLAVKGHPVGWFAPDYKISSEAYTDIIDILEPIKKGSNRVDGIIRTKTGGRIDFWTLDNERAGRSRKYKHVIIDEAAFTKPNVMDIWERSIRPTLLDLGGTAWVFSTPQGVNDDNFFYRICHDPKYGFEEYHSPTYANPHLPAEELAKLESENHPLVYRQEYLAEFVDWRGVQFFDIDKCLENGNPVAWPTACDVVYAVIDTGTKTGREHDGTAVTYYALTRRGSLKRLYVLDWDIVQIEGSLLETWLPTVFQNLQMMALKCGARIGTIGAMIEDQNSGSILLQQAKRKNWMATAIDSDLMMRGKDGRAISVSAYVYQGLVKLTNVAHDKVSSFHEAIRNHFLKQVFTFKVGIDNKEDDLLDTFTYGVAIAFGDSKGH